MSNKILVLTDNPYLLNGFKFIVEDIRSDHEFVYRCSPTNKSMSDVRSNDMVEPIDVKTNVAFICSTFDLVISLHCKQIFPANLVHGVRCVNVHPGLNPYNRGWYPQVFSIINGLPAGATIHEIDEELDHGMIIAQREVRIESWDTSASLYSKVVQTELDLVREYLLEIIGNEYEKQAPTFEGNINLKKDFDDLLKIDLKKTATYGDVINHLRAVTFEGYRNAFFLDENGQKVYVEITLAPSGGNIYLSNNTQIDN